MAIVQTGDRQKEREEKGWDNDRERLPRLEVEGNGFVVAPVGFERFQSGQKGTPGLLVRFVVLEDPPKWDGETTVGSVVDKEFWLTGKRTDLADFALAMGWKEPFDDEDDAAIERVLLSGCGACKITVKEEEYNGNSKYRPQFFNALRGVLKPKDEWEETINAGVSDWDAYFEWRQKNPRPAPGTQPAQSSGRGGASSRGGGGGGGGSDSRRRGTSDRQAQRQEEHTFNPDDDIPF